MDMGRDTERFHTVPFHIPHIMHLPRRGASSCAAHQAYSAHHASSTSRRILLRRSSGVGASAPPSSRGS
eukprot:5182213-Prymnesium_polylepis.1